MSIRKAFFGPGPPDWSEQQRTFAYGNHDSLAIGGWNFDQRDYAAIVLVNPPIGSNRSNCRPGSSAIGHDR